MSVVRRWDAWSCTVSVTVEGGSPDRAERVVRDLMADVDAAVSRFRDDAELVRVARHGGRLVPASALTVELVQVALQAARATDGAVDPTLGADLAALGYDADLDVVRGAPRGRSAGTRHGGPDEPHRPGWRSVRVDPELRLVGVPAGVGLDLGAVAKAWTADEAARRVHALDGHAALVEIGGDLALAGRPSRPWQVDVAELRGEAGTRVALTDGGLATSSTQERRWTTADGTPAHHLLDPRTGRPADGPWRTVTVWAPTAVLANTLSTAAVVRGPEARPWLERDDVAARVVTLDGAVEHVGGWPPETEVAA
ncbi:thiamine biosynthesis lipoprotein [Aeromicrobium sp. SORGH_AS981]|uniref:FAD:protein FMN transferase n=1 Tax=Aeromicrobium sp. SORGH_AS_0981 TaxID=3041802 RepID=UPI00285FF549|nr:FAD:protein FMN transferase [Aeromicrobium sp. SORGH_AS_0981]MDR6117467.1 thiamine biosynthesis lipoprotein [Aeromicrobium sp. SORGH_AS_0981]